MARSSFQSKINELFKMKIAGIDIGTNTILMTIAEKKADESLEILCDEHSIARLGEKTDNTTWISPDAISRAVNILKNYKNICDNEQVDEIQIVTTSAMRDAKNGEEVRYVLENTIQSKIKIISGEEEARLSFLGTVENELPASVIDIGGGSTEVISGTIEELTFIKSLKIGAVRLTERFFNVDCLTEDMVIAAKAVIKNEFKSNIQKEFFKGNLYAVAGTPTTIAAVCLNLKEYDFNKVNGYILSKDSINHVLDLFLRFKPEEISKKYNIHPLRADVITAGTIILSEAMEYLNIERCIVSALGLRFGIIKNYIKNYS